MPGAQAIAYEFQIGPDRHGYRYGRMASGLRTSEKRTNGDYCSYLVYRCSRDSEEHSTGTVLYLCFINGRWTAVRAKDDSTEFEPRHAAPVFRTANLREDAREPGWHA